MERGKAQDLIQNLLDRLLQLEGRYELPGGIISPKERAALALLADVDDSDDVPGRQNTSGATSTDRPAAPAIVSQAVRLSDDCLGTARSDEAVMCVDFGTAFSKAALWLDGDDAPVPIDLGVAAGGTGLLVDSAAFISEDHLFFGPEAIRRFAQEGDVTRAMFASPKEHLTHDHARFQADRPASEVDPTKLFRTRDLLALYLGYLTSLIGDRAAALGVGRHVLRRFAAPGWGDAQISKSTPHFEAVAAQLKHLLIDAQILADTLPSAIWRDGLDVATARSALDELALIPSERREAATFVERSVLEAVAAATGVQDRLVNQRPQVLVIDVGAGTTDIGAFKYNVNAGGSSVAAYRDGMRAIRMAGNRLDDALVDLAWSKLGLASDSQLKPTHARKVRPGIRDHKQDLFKAQAVRIEVDGFEGVDIELDEFCRTRFVSYFAKSFEDGVKNALNGAGVGSRNFTQTNQTNVAVFTGGGGTLPFLREVLQKPIQLEGGTAHFEIRDPVPAWVDSYDASVAAAFPQIAVATGGCAPHLPDEKSSVMDTSVAPMRSIAPNYR